MYEDESIDDLSKTNTGILVFPISALCLKMYFITCAICPRKNFDMVMILSCNV